MNSHKEVKHALSILSVGDRFCDSPSQFWLTVLRIFQNGSLLILESGGKEPTAYLSAEAFGERLKYSTLKDSYWVNYMGNFGEAWVAKYRKGWEGKD